MENKTKFNLELYILLIPAIAGLIMISGRFLPIPDIFHSLLSFFVLISTTVLIVLEASKNGTVKDGVRRMSPPTMWVFYLLILWVVAYPIYMYRRKNIGLPNRIWLALASCVVYLSGIVFGSVPAEEQLYGADVDMAVVFPDGNWNDEKRKLAAKGTVTQMIYFADGVRDGLYRGDYAGFADVAEKSATIAIAWNRQENLTREQRACHAAATYMVQATIGQSMHDYELFLRNLEVCKLAY